MQKYAGLGHPGAEIPRHGAAPVQKCRSFWAPGGAYVALFSPAGRSTAVYAGIVERAQFLVPSRTRRDRILALVPNAAVLGAKTAARVPLVALTCLASRDPCAHDRLL